MVHLRKPEPSQKPDTHPNNTPGNDQSDHKCLKVTCFKTFNMHLHQLILQLLFLPQSHLPHHTNSALCIAQLDM